MRSLLRFSVAGTRETLALPALKREITVKALSQSAKALLPPHPCGGSHHIPPTFSCLLCFGRRLGRAARRVSIYNRHL